MVLEEALESLIEGFVEIIPNLLAGILFLIIAYVGIKIVKFFVSSTLRGKYRHEMSISLINTIVSIFLWFGAVLVFLNILGLGEIAASLGTATGFIALGISFALSRMIADSVAGFYLIRDPDFEIGDRVVTEEDVEGEVLDVGLRKSRLELENGDLAVIANSKIEEKWVRKELEMV